MVNLVMMCSETVDVWAHRTAKRDRFNAGSCVRKVAFLLVEFDSDWISSLNDLLSLIKRDPPGLRFASRPACAQTCWVFRAQSASAISMWWQVGFIQYVFLENFKQNCVLCEEFSSPITWSIDGHFQCLHPSVWHGLWWSRVCVWTFEVLCLVCCSNDWSGWKLRWLTFAKQHIPVTVESQPRHAWLSHTKRFISDAWATVTLTQEPPQVRAIATWPLVLCADQVTGVKQLMTCDHSLRRHTTTPFKSTRPVEKSFTQKSAQVV